MNLQKLIILVFATFMSIVCYGQLFHSMGLMSGLGNRQGNFSQPRMHIEGDSLYVCTSKGLYAKNLTNSNNVWQLVGFENVPLQDYARQGNDILALRYNKGGNFLLLSHDGGQTYEDITPDIFCSEKHEILPCLAQHPTDSSILLVSSLYWGIFRSADFGQTWENLTECLYGNRAASFIGFHPACPSIIYNSGEGYIFDGHIIISYDAGQTWNDHGDSLGFPGDNCVHRPAFHPTNPECWIAGGEGVVYSTTDNGYTWNCQNFWDDVRRVAYWFFSAFDAEHPDTIYMAGNTTGDLGAIKVMYSTDGGKSWSIPQTEPRKNASIECVNDLQQYSDKLLIYSESDVYEVSKTELLEQCANSLQVISDTVGSSDIYDLQGRKVNSNSKIQNSKSKKGIYIQKGKKVVK